MYRNVPMTKKKISLVITKWQHHILCWIKIFYASQIKVKISVTADNLFPSAGQKRMKRKTKQGREEATETIKSRKGEEGSQNRAQILSDGHTAKLAGMTEQILDAVNTLLCFDAVTSILPKKRHCVQVPHHFTST